MDETKQTKQTQPWSEKYRPSKLEDIADQQHVVQALRKQIISTNLPHLILWGPAGTGKTSTIRAFTLDLYGAELVASRVLELNASHECGIDVIRKKVKRFAQVAVDAGQKPPYKLIILDEADSLTPDAQSALRRTMEQYSKVTRFVIICNYVSKIIEPIASRCAKFRYKPLTSDVALARLQGRTRSNNTGSGRNCPKDQQW